MESVLSAHVTHKSAGVDRLETIGSQNTLYLLKALRMLPGVRECAVLKTCNRVELYTVTCDWSTTRRQLEILVNSFIPFDSNQNLVQYLDGDGSIRHLLRVSSGLESMIVGEDQIQSQVKEAFELAEREGCIGPILSLIFRKAIYVGKKVRTETKVNKGGVSVGSAAVELAERKIGDLRGKSVLVVGAGEMATLIAKHLMGKGPEAVFVSNRTYSRAVELAWELDGKAVRFDSLVDFLVKSDVVICATSATHMILEGRHVWPAVERREDRPIIIIDVSVPRNVAPEVSEIPGVQLFDMDGLRGVAAENMLRRKSEVKDAERIISAEIARLRGRLDELAAEMAIKCLYRKFNGIRDREVRKAVGRARAGDDVEEVMKDFADALIYRFLADPTETLKGASRNGEGQLPELVTRLFKTEERNDVPGEQASQAEDEGRDKADGK